MEDSNLRITTLAISDLHKLAIFVGNGSILGDSRLRNYAAVHRISENNDFLVKDTFIIEGVEGSIQNAMFLGLTKEPYFVVTDDKNVHIFKVEIDSLEYKIQLVDKVEAHKNGKNLKKHHFLFLLFRRNKLCFHF